MVPVITDVKEPSRSWWDVLRTARAHLRDLAGRSPLDGAMGRYLLRTVESTGVHVELPPIDTDAFLAGYAATATHAATLGFLLASGGSAGCDAEKHFLEGVDRCVRQEMPTSGPSVHRDARLLLGLAAGLSHMADTADRRTWLEKRLATLATEPDISRSALAAYGLTLIGKNAGWGDLEETIRKVEIRTPGDAAVALWALQIEPTRFSDSGRNELDRTRQRALQIFPLIDVQTLDACTSTMVAITASRLLQASVWDLEKTALARLLDILCRFPTAMARETGAPRNEYEVQRILWTMLAGVYPDLRDEQWLAQFGVYQPRADLAIETMRLVIEAKYVRKASDFRKIQDEIVADATTYTQKPERFDKVLAVIYDVTSSQHKYDQLRSALESVDGIVKVIIISQSTPRPTLRKTKSSHEAPKKSRARS